MKAIEQLRINGGLPSPKGVALAIMQISRRDDATLEEISRLVQSDPVTSGRLLHMANAASVGARPLASIPEAIIRLGLAAVRQLAMGFSLVDQYRSGACKSFDYPRFWSHSLLMAVAMQELGKRVRLASPDELFACGLLARIGQLALATLYPEEYAQLLQRGDETTVEAERQLLHVDHNELTAVILEDCGIPRALAEPVFFHENVEAASFAEGSRPYQLTRLFHLARRLADSGRVLLRPSGTEPAIRVMVEARETETAERLAGQLASAVRLAMDGEDPEPAEDPSMAQMRRDYPVVASLRPLLQQDHSGEEFDIALEELLERIAAIKDGTGE